MQTATFESLGPPPRELPRRIILSSIFGDVQMMIGLLFLGIGIIVSVAFLSFSDLSIWKFWISPLTPATATVLRTESANMTINDDPAYTIYYEYQDETGKKIEGKGISMQQLEPETPIAVEYIANEPGRSRIQNSGWLQLMLLMPLMSGLFPLIGLIMVLVLIPKIRRRLYLLREGYLAYGDLTAKSETNTRINNQRVYKFEYVFKSQEGMEYPVIARTHRVENMPEKNASVLYASEDPNNAIVIQALPFDLQLGDSQLMTTAVAKGYLKIIFIAAVTFALMIGGVVVLFLMQNQ